jgi:hypothetical protein
MKNFFLYVAILAVCFFVSCASRPAQNPQLEKHLSEVSSTPPVHYTKTVNVYFVKGKPDWNEIPVSLIATTVLTETSRTAGIGIPLQVQSAQNGKQIFFRVSWTDAAHVSSAWEKTEKLSFNWGVHSSSFSDEGCGAACHFWPPALARGRVSGMWLMEPDGLVDNWMWFAVSSHFQKIQHRILTGKPVVVHETMIMDGMKMPHMMKLAYYPDPFVSGLKADGTYEKGQWVVVISRDLQTKNPREVQFVPEKKSYYTFGISVFPGVMYHDYSGMLTLHFLSH